MRIICLHICTVHIAIHTSNACMHAWLEFFATTAAYNSPKQSTIFALDYPCTVLQMQCMHSVHVNPLRGIYVHTVRLTSPPLTKSSD